MRKVFSFLPVLLFFFIFKADAYLRLPDIFSDNMVLQQQTTIQFHGWANPGQKISVIAGWNNDTLKAVAISNASWTVNLRTPTAGGPYQIIVIGDTTLAIQNVLVGDNWVCSGQSNMEFSADWHKDYYKTEVENANHPPFAFFTFKKLLLHILNRKYVAAGKFVHPLRCILSVQPPIFLEEQLMKVFISLSA